MGLLGTGALLAAALACVIDARFARALRFAAAEQAFGAAGLVTSRGWIDQKLVTSDTLALHYWSPSLFRDAVAAVVAGGGAGLSVPSWTGEWRYCSGGSGLLTITSSLTINRAHQHSGGQRR